MTQDQYDEIMNTLDEWVPIESHLGMKPRLRDFQQDLKAIQLHGNPVTVQEMDWETIDGLLTEKYNAFLKDYAVAQVRDRNVR